MKVVVTGSSGFIGSNVVRALKNREIEVIELDTSIGRDVCKLNLVEFLPKNLDIIFHFAATNGTKKFYETPSDILVNNTMTTLCFNEYLSMNPDVRFIFASTCEIQNSMTEHGCAPVPTAESHLVGFEDTMNPRWSYSIPKLLGENFISNISKNFLILRYFNIFGREQKDHFIPEFVDRARQGTYSIYGNDTRSFCYIDDAVEMTLTAALSEYSNEILNIGNPEEYKIIDVAQIILKRMGLQSENIKVFNGLNGSATRRSPDITKYNEIFGKYSYTSLEDAIAEFLKCDAKEI